LNRASNAEIVPKDFFELASTIINRDCKGYKNMEKLLNELKSKIVEVLNLQDVNPDEIDPDEQLVGGRLGIDSIDVLEMVMMIEQDYGVVIDNKELGAQVFVSLNTLAAYLQSQSPELPN
jgi:acyl carrier protein